MSFRNFDSWFFQFWYFQFKIEREESWLPFSNIHGKKLSAWLCKTLSKARQTQLSDFTIQNFLRGTESSFLIEQPVYRFSFELPVQSCHHKSETVRFVVIPLFVFKRKAQAVCLGRQARNSQFLRKFPPLFSISSKNQLKMWSSHDSVSWTKIGFACRPFFSLAKSSRHPPANWGTWLVLINLDC